MKWLHNVGLLLLPCGFLYYCYGLYVGGGLSGWLNQWQIERRAALAVGLAEAFAFFVLVVAPLILVTNTEKRSVPLRPDTLRPLGIFFSVLVVLSSITGFAAWQSLQRPDLNAKPKLLDVERASGDLEEGMVRLVGQGQSGFMLSYTAASSLGSGATRTTSSARRSIFPVTPILWKPQEPVRFLFSSRTEPALIGILQRNALPGYLRTLIEKKGIRLADPYYVVDNYSYLAAKGEWDAVWAIGGFFSFFLWIFFFAIYWPFVDLRRRLGWLPRP